MTARPAVLMDVDGVLNPFDAPPNRRPPGYTTHRFDLPDRKPLRVWLHPGHGAMIGTLADRFDLLWATTWEHAANTWVAPRVGLPEMPVIEFGADPTSPRPDLDLGRRVHWKTETIAVVMAGRFFVWVDDEATGADVEYLATRHSTGAAVYRVDPAVGLLPEDIEAIRGITEPGLYAGPTRRDLRRRARDATT